MGSDPQWKMHSRVTCTRHPLDDGSVQSSRLLDAANSKQQKHHAAAMRAVATVSVASCFIVGLYVSFSFDLVV